MDGADAPALFSVTRETGWAALPARPAALRRNPAFQGRVFHFVSAPSTAFQSSHINNSVRLTA